MIETIAQSGMTESTYWIICAFLVPFVPDPSRLEAINVGVLLFCPERHFISVRTARSNRRARKLLDGKKIDHASLKAAKSEVERRVEVDRDSFKTLNDLQLFVDTRANILKLTDPRPIKVHVPEEDLENLFKELVGGIARERRKHPFERQLDELFANLEQQGRAHTNWEVTVPKLGSHIHAPYAFRNGTWNLVKTQLFSSKEQSAMSSSMRLAMEGDLLHRHGADQYGKTKLIVVAAFEKAVIAGDLEIRVCRLLKEYHVEPVPETELPAFASQVALEAHP